MRRSLRVIPAVCLLLYGFAVCPQDKAAPEKKGKFIGNNAYTNPALGMTLRLPGEWQFFERTAQEKMGVAKEEGPPNEGCPGPFCRSLEIDVALISGSLNGAIFINGYKLAPQYLDRRRYPLKMFAENMLTGSVGGTDWTVAGELTPIQLDNRTAYRLLVHKPEPVGQAKGFGYVSEANGYVFLLIGTVPDIRPEYPKQLQSSLENMKLGEAEAAN